MPKMTHKGSSAEIEVVPEQVPMYRSQGWSEKSTPKAEPKKTAAPKK